MALNLTGTWRQIQNAFVLEMARCLQPPSFSKQTTRSCEIGNNLTKHYTNCVDQIWCDVLCTCLLSDIGVLALKLSYQIVTK